ncbi:MAG TPA: toll/interleukin-1 receptor domain-containing protein [Allosphingosinicella sp.]|nr:toll/interleukin-1 receptor domain-containing protein [Allosphingosinicella sp.]
MSDIFISYKNDDRKRVAHLVAALRTAGLDVWWDQDIPPGGGWRDTIAAQLDRAKLCVVAWSQASTGPEGRFVREEAERTAARGAYLGVLIDPVLPPFGFAEWQSIDLSSWNGRAKHPLLDHFVDQVRARLEGVPQMPSPASAPRRRSLARPLLIGGGLLALAAAGLLVWSLLPGRPPASPTAFVNARLNRSACAWLQIASVTPAEGDRERVALAGIAASPTAVQAGLMRRAMDANVPIAEIDVSEVATGPNETCAQIELLRQYRWNGRSRLTVIPPRGALRRTQYGWSGRFEFEVDMQGLPQHAALLGLDSVGGLEVLIPDLNAFRRQHPPLRTSGTRVAYEGYFFDENQNARNVGLILMTSDAPIDEGIVGQIGRSGDRAVLERIDQAARSRQWQFELALVRCGFETGGQRRRC